MTFKVGDIIANIENGKTAKVIAVNKHEYLLERQFGSKNSTEFPIYWVDRNFTIHTKLHKVLE